MKRLSLFVQWLAVAGLAGFVAYVIVRPTPLPDYDPSLWNDWAGVTVLSYAGIARSATPEYPSVRQLEAQLSALRDAGYRTVRPEDVRAFLDGRTPLPQKALLLIFEGGRKEAFIRATPVLQRTGFSAVIAIPTSVMDRWGGFYLKRGDVRKVARLPLWTIGSMGHRAVEPPPGGGKDERFLAHRAQLDGHPESTDAFRERITGDYTLSSRLLTEAAGSAPLLYLYPYGEAGQSPSADPFAEALNREAVTRHFGLAFVGAVNAFNGPGSDPWSLSRLRVHGDWSSETLLAELAACRPRQTPLAVLGDARQWSFERDAGLRDGHLSVQPGAAAWLRGTEAWSDIEADASIQPEANGRASLYVRYAGLRTWLRAMIDASGVRVQECVGGSLITLCRHAAPADTQAARRVRLRVRNNRAWLWVNGQIVAENLPVSPATRRGRVGIGSEGATSGVLAFSAMPLPSRWLLADSIRLVPEAARGDIQAVLPSWFRAGEAPRVDPTDQQDLLRAAAAGIRTLPVLTGGHALADADADRWAEAVDAALARADLKTLVPVLAIDAPAEPLSRQLRNRGYRIAHLLNAAQAMEFGRILALEDPEGVIVINETGDAADRAIRWLTRTVPAQRLFRREPPASGTASGVTTALAVGEAPYPQ